MYCDVLESISNGPSEASRGSKWFKPLDRKPPSLFRVCTMAAGFNLQTVSLSATLLTVITVCANVHHKNMLRVSLLSTSKSYDLDLGDYERVMDLAPAIFSRDNNNISFYSLVEHLRAELLKPNTVAIIASGEPVVDGVASLFASCLSVPLINVRNTTALPEVGL